MAAFRRRQLGKRLWRGIGFAFVVVFIIAYVIYGDHPNAGVSAEELVSFTTAIARGS